MTEHAGIYRLQDRAGVILLLSIILAVPLASTRPEQNTGSGFPESVDRELNEAIRRAAPAARIIRGDFDRYLVAVQPYGPLDLDVSNPDAGTPVAKCRRYFLGAMSFASQVDQERHRGAVRRIQCAAECFESERKYLLGHLEAARELASQFNRFSIRVFAIWPDGAYRLDRTVVARDGFTELVGSLTLDALPWATRTTGTLAADTAAAHGTAGTIRRFADRLLAFRVCAMVRERPGVLRMVLSGSVCTTEAGFLLHQDRQKPATLGAVTQDGREYVALQLVAPGATFYTTR